MQIMSVNSVHCTVYRVPLYHFCHTSTDPLSTSNIPHPLERPSADSAEPYSDNFGNFLRRLPFALAFTFLDGGSYLTFYYNSTVSSYQGCVSKSLNPDPNLELLLRPDQDQSFLLQKISLRFEMFRIVSADMLKEMLKKCDYTKMASNIFEITKVN